MASRQISHVHVPHPLLWFSWRSGFVLSRNARPPYVPTWPLRLFWGRTQPTRTRTTSKTSKNPKSPFFDQGGRVWNVGVDMGLSLLRSTCPKLSSTCLKLRRGRTKSRSFAGPISLKCQKAGGKMADPENWYAISRKVLTSRRRDWSFRTSKRPLYFGSVSWPWCTWLNFSPSVPKRTSNVIEP